MDKARVEVYCRFCGTINYVEVEWPDYWDWQYGMPAQDAFPYLTPDEREMLISGTCPKCWDEIFGVEK